MTESVVKKGGINIVMISSEQIYSLWLYYPPKGRLYFSDQNNQRVDIPIYFDGTDKGWIVKTTTDSQFAGLDGSYFTSKTISDQFIAAIRDENNQYLLYAEEADSQTSAFHHYRIRSNTEIRIGRSEDNDIIYYGALMSRHGATLSYQNNFFKVRDLHSANGIFVNGKRCSESELKLGDSIYIMGLQIIVGCGFISVNDDNRFTSIDTRKVIPVNSTDEVINSKPKYRTEQKQKLFNRYPRKMLSMPVNDIVIEGPPVSMSGNKIPLLLQVGSPLAMGATSVLSGFGNPAYIATSMMFPLLNAGFSEKQRKDYEERRVKFYTEYLGQKDKEIEIEKKNEEDSLRLNYPSLNTVLSYALNQKQRLWERRREDKDFLLLRIGAGNLPMQAKIEYPKERFHLEKDKLEEDMRELGSRKVFLENVPVILDLKKDIAIGVQGSEQMIMFFVRATAMRIAELYSYDEVKMIFLCRSEQLDKIEFIRYLPHVFDDMRSVRFIAVNENDAVQINKHLKDQFQKDIENETDLKNILKKRPYYIVFSLDKSLFDASEIIKEAISKEQSVGLSLFALYDDLPKECSLLLKLDDRGVNTITYLKDPEKPDYHFEIDPVLDQKMAFNSMHEIANTALKSVQKEFSLPKSVNFLDMYRVGNISHLNVLQRWKESNPVKSLAAPIGIGTDGQTFYLDLHQKSQGPHGLVAGMTGSGKSEFLITYILSMAINYDPNDVAFLLIDYKGGGLAGAFDDPARGIHLPHLVGTITNLDGSTMQRSFAAVQSELSRRQRIFNHAKTISGEGTMDIYIYQRLFHSGIVKDPLPHLFIISDEFAELKQQQPEFLDQLISIARIGRSLGVHLILATQKPSGVVNDQIRSNTKFQVCLKVQDRTDSIDMLDKPDAAELKETGRFYIQVGYHEYYAMGQAAWSGCEYIPQDAYVEQVDDSIDTIDNTGQISLSQKPVKDSQTVQGTQLTAIVRYLSELAMEEKIEPRQLWMAPLPKVLSAEKMKQNNQSEENGIQAVVGMMDDPQNQRQLPLNIEIQNKGNLLIFGDQGSGKTTFLQTLLLTLSEKYTSEDVNYYILDYSSRSLKLFQSLPHTGAVLDEDQNQYIQPFFELIDNIIQKRKKLFEQQEVDTFEASNEIQKLPLVLVVIDNLAALGEINGGYQYFSKFDDYLKAGTTYGIRYIVSVNHINDVSIRIRQEMPYRIAFHMKDNYDYGEALNIRTKYEPLETPGRGMVEFEGRGLEFQIAKFMAGESNKDRLQKLKEEMKEIANRNVSYKPAETLPIINTEQSYDDFCEQFKKGRIPLGYNLDNSRTVALPLSQFDYLSLYFGQNIGIEPVLNNFVYALKRDNLNLVVLKKKSMSLFDESMPEMITFEINEDGIDQFKKTIEKDLQERSDLLISYCNRNHVDLQSIDNADNEEYKKAFDYMQSNKPATVILIESMAEFCLFVKNKQEKDVDYAKQLMRLTARAAVLDIKTLACFYPGEMQQLSSDFYNKFWSRKTILLFGGNYTKQDLVNAAMITPPEVPLNYNVASMLYRDEIHSLFMPCGKLKQNEENDESASIF